MFKDHFIKAPIDELDRQLQVSLIGEGHSYQRTEGDNGSLKFVIKDNETSIDLVTIVITVVDSHHQFYERVNSLGWLYIFWAVFANANDLTINQWRKAASIARTVVQTIEHVESPNKPLYVNLTIDEMVNIARQAIQEVRVRRGLDFDAHYNNELGDHEFIFSRNGIRFGQIVITPDGKGHWSSYAIRIINDAAARDKIVELYMQLPEDNKPASVIPTDGLNELFVEIEEQWKQAARNRNMFESKMAATNILSTVDGEQEEVDMPLPDVSLSRPKKEATILWLDLAHPDPILLHELQEAREQRQGISGNWTRYAEILIKSTPHGFAVMAQEFAPNTFKAYGNDLLRLPRKIKPNANPVRVYFADPNHLPVPPQPSIQDKDFKLPHWYGLIKAQKDVNGRTRLFVEAMDNYWSELEGLWLGLYAELERQGWVEVATAEGEDVIVHPSQQTIYIYNEGGQVFQKNVGRDVIGHDKVEGDVVGRDKVKLSKETDNEHGEGSIPEWVTILMRTLRQHFDENTLPDLILHLGIDPEIISGNSTYAKARELALYIWRHNLHAKLVEVGPMVNSGIDWSGLSEKIT